jgi:hypothetical protein
MKIMPQCVIETAKLRKKMYILQQKLCFFFNVMLAHAVEVVFKCVATE